MGVVEDIMDGIEDILQSVLDSGLAKLLEVLISGFTLVFSAPTIALATIFNDSPGFIDPLMLPPIPVTYGKFEIHHFSDVSLTAELGEFALRDPPPGSFLTPGHAPFVIDEYDHGLPATVMEFALP